MNRYQHMQHNDDFEKQRLQTKVETYNAGKKNQGGAAFNLIDLNYEKNPRGQQLKQLDDDAVVRATIRAENLQRKGNGNFNILTGTETSFVQAPYHERYNPISGAAQQIMGSSHSNRQVPQS